MGVGGRSGLCEEGFWEGGEWEDKGAVAARSGCIVPSVGGWARPLVLTGRQAGGSLRMCCRSSRIAMPSGESQDSWATPGRPCSGDGSLRKLRKSIKSLASQFLFMMSRWASAMTSFSGDLAVAILPREPWPPWHLGMGAETCLPPRIRPPSDPMATA